MRRHAPRTLHEQTHRRHLVQQPQLRLGLLRRNIAENSPRLGEHVIHIRHHPPRIPQRIPLLDPMPHQPIIPLVIVGRPQIPRGKHLLLRFQKDFLPRNLPMTPILHQGDLERDVPAPLIPTPPRQSDDQSGPRPIHRHRARGHLPPPPPQQPLPGPNPENAPHAEIGIDDAAPIQGIEPQRKPIEILVLLLLVIGGQDVRLDRRLLRGRRGEDAGVSDGREDGVVAVDVEVELLVPARVLGAGVGVLDVILEEVGDVSGGFAE